MEKKTKKQNNTEREGLHKARPYGFHSAKKSLGQNFLNSEGALLKIIKAGKLEKTDIVLEIGPGRGALTKKLLETGVTILAVEKDTQLVTYLRDRFNKEIMNNQLIVTEGDILDFDIKKHGLKNRSYKLIANIPYNITGAIFRKFLGHEAMPSTIVLLVQEEVALRITADTTKESILSLSIKAYGSPRYVGKVSRGSFFPSPQVDSAILCIDNITKKNFVKQGPALELFEEFFFSVLHAGFAHKRKVLRSNLELVANKESIDRAFTSLGLDKNTRAEDVPLSTWFLLCKEIKKR